MKVSIEEIDRAREEEVIIRCHEVDRDILKLVDQIKNSQQILLGYEGESIHRIRYSAIYYIEAVDSKVFIYSKDKVLESKQRLYELEESLSGKKFFRASKSIILNVTKIASVKPSISGRFEASLENGEKVIVSRQYVPVLKNILGI